MPRMGRVVVPGYPHHIIQRGHNRQVVFAEEADYRYYLNTLAQYKEVCEVRVYGYCLMTNHVHLLLEPETAAGLGALMKRLAGRQTRFVNRQEPRTGTLWEGRYKSSPVQTDTYLLACLRYIELNPVRAHMVTSPAEYPWSSYRFHAGEVDGPEWLDTDRTYKALGATPEERATRYRAYLDAGVPEMEWELISGAVQRGHLTGNRRFVEEVEGIIGRRIEQRKRGRPRHDGSV